MYIYNKINVLVKKKNIICRTGAWRHCNTIQARMTLHLYLGHQESRDYSRGSLRSYPHSFSFDFFFTLGRLCCPGFSAFCILDHDNILPDYWKIIQKKKRK